MAHKNRCTRLFFAAAWLLTGIWTVTAAPGNTGSNSLSAGVGKEDSQQQIITPLKVSAKPIIDGNLDDEAWQHPPLAEDFLSFSPQFGEIIPFQTQVWSAYDSENFYFAVLCLDPDPQQIKTSLTKRDNMFNDDWFGLFIDTIGNRQKAYGFFLNPSGIQADSLYSAVGGEDGSIDFVWESAGKITAKGYQLEIKIPLRSINYKSGKEVTMGIFFCRKITRLGVYGSYPLNNPSSGLLNSLAPIVYKDIKKQQKMEILPSITYSSNRERASLAEWAEPTNETAVGIGMKYGLSSSSAVEVTVNPDFSQVESDAFQVEVNQRYPLFYSEKRPFFMEGADNFNFFTLPGGYLPRAVHTRQIVDPLWGAKLTGTAGKTAFGILAAGDEWPGMDWEDGQNPDAGRQAFFGIARGKYSLGNANYIGVLYSGREFAGQYNRVFGGDLGYWFAQQHKISFSYLYSMSGNSGNSGNDGNNGETQQEAGALNFMYLYRNKKWIAQGGYAHIGSQFRMDSAYLMRTGIDDGFVSLQYNFNPQIKKIPWLRQFSTIVEGQYLHDIGSGMNDSSIFLGINASFTREGYVNLSHFRGKECWQGQSFDIRRFTLSTGVQLTKWLRLAGVAGWGDRIYYEVDPAYTGQGWDTSLELSLQPNRNINQQFCFYHADLKADALKLYDVNILFSRTTYQFNKYFFLRAVIQYDSYQQRMLTDFLASFTLIPGTVIHVGYGGLYENRDWIDNQWVYRQGGQVEIKRSFFLKASYLWRF